MDGHRRADHLQLVSAKRNLLAWLYGGAKVKKVKLVVPPLPEPVRPSILDPNFKYTPAAATDVQATWRRFGWKPLEKKHEDDRRV